MDSSSNIDSDVYLLVAAILHMVHEIRRRLDGDLRSHPIEPILLHLVATTITLTELTEATSANDLSGADPDRLALDAGRSWLLTDAEGLRGSVDRARVAWSALCRTAEHDINAAELEKNLADLEISLDGAETHARAIHNQLADGDTLLELDNL